MVKEISRGITVDHDLERVAPVLMALSSWRAEAVLRGSTVACRAAAKGTPRGGGGAVPGVGADDRAVAAPAA